MECENNNTISNTNYNSPIQPNINSQQYQTPNVGNCAEQNIQSRNLNQPNGISLYNANTSVNPYNSQNNYLQQDEINQNNTVQSNSSRESPQPPLNSNLQNVPSGIMNQSNAISSTISTHTNTQTINPQMNSMDQNSLQGNNNNFHTTSVSNTNNNQYTSNSIRSESSIVYKDQFNSNHESIHSTIDINKTCPSTFPNNQAFAKNDIPSYSDYVSSHSSSNTDIPTNINHSGPISSDPELLSAPSLTSPCDTNSMIPPIPSTKSVNEKIPSSKIVNENIPSTKSVYENIPSTKSVYENIPSTKSAYENIPSSNSINTSTNLCCNNENLNTNTGLQQNISCNSSNDVSKTDCMNNQNTNSPVLHPCIKNSNKDNKNFSVDEHLIDSGVDIKMVSPETKRDIEETHESYAPNNLKKSNNVMHDETKTNTTDSSMKLFSLSDALKLTKYLEYNLCENGKKSLNTISKNKYVTLYEGSMFIDMKQHNVFMYEVNPSIPSEYLNQIISGINFQAKYKLPWSIYAFGYDDSNHPLYFIYINDAHYKSLYDIIKSNEEYSSSIKKEIANQLYDYIIKLKFDTILFVDISIYTVYFSFDKKTIAIHDLGFTRYIDVNNPSLTSISIYDYPLIYKQKKRIPAQYIYSVYLCIYQLYTHYSIIPFNASLTKIFELLKNGEWIFAPQLCVDTDFYDLMSNYYKKCQEESLKEFIRKLN